MTDTERPPDVQISDAFAEYLAENECPACGGDGWYVVHEDACYDTGDCQCGGGMKVQCECVGDAK